MKVNNGMFLDRSSGDKLIEADKVLPQTGKDRERLVAYLDEYPFTEFVLGVLQHELRDAHRYEDGKTEQLVEVPGYQDVPVQADRLVKGFNSLPWTYVLTIGLPPALGQLLGHGETEVRVSDALSIVRATEAFREQFKPAPRYELERSAAQASVIAALFERAMPKWENDGVYAQIRTEGYIGPYGGTPTASEAERRLRSVMGIGLATRLFDFQPVYSSDVSKQTVFVHLKLADDSWTLVARYSLDEAVARGLRGLTIDTSEAARGLFLTPEQWIAARLKDIGTVLSGGNTAEPVVSAGQWLFDSHASSDELLGFVQGMIVLEILLGEREVSDKVGIIELIANRFAYLIGTTHSQRKDYIDHLRQIYRVRSQIVHSGKHRLSFQERVLFATLKWMGKRALDKEIRLLKAGEALPF